MEDEAALDATGTGMPGKDDTWGTDAPSSVLREIAVKTRNVTCAGDPALKTKHPASSRSRRLAAGSARKGLTGEVTAMDREVVMLQKLMGALDDSSNLYARLAPGTTRSHVKLLLERAIRVHQGIADELAERVRAAGGTPRRGGSALGALRALRAHWLARTSPDTELAYVAQATRCEDGVLRCFDAAVAAVTDVELRDHLHLHLREIERVCVQMECLGPPSPIEASTEPTLQWLQVTAEQSGLRVVVQARPDVAGA